MYVLNTLLSPSVLCVQEGARVGLQRRHHPPSVLQAKEWRAQPLPLLPQNRDVPAHAGPALPGDTQQTVSRLIKHSHKRGALCYDVSELHFPEITSCYLFLLVKLEFLELLVCIVASSATAAWANYSFLLLFV